MILKIQLHGLKMKFGNRFIFFTVLLILTFDVLRSQDFVEDIDGNIYKTITIRNQVWMAENLKVTSYNNGTKIPLINDENIWADTLIGAYYLPIEYEEYFVDRYGLLYNHYAVSCENGLCPEGWHVPNSDEWKILIEYLGGEKKAGAKMKNLETGLWINNVINSNTLNLFNALPSGGKGRYGEIGGIGSYATWWSSTSYDENYAWHWGLHPDKTDIRYNPGHKNSGFSIRCIKDS